MTATLRVACAWHVRHVACARPLMSAMFAMSGRCRRADTHRARAHLQLAIGPKANQLAKPS